MDEEATVDYFCLLSYLASSSHLVIVVSNVQYAYQFD